MTESVISARATIPTRGWPATSRTPAGRGRSCRHLGARADRRAPAPRVTSARPVVEDQHAAVEREHRRRRRAGPTAARPWRAPRPPRGRRERGRGDDAGPRRLAGGGVEQVMRASLPMPGRRRPTWRSPPSAAAAWDRAFAPERTLDRHARARRARAGRRRSRRRTARRARSSAAARSAMKPLALPPRSSRSARRAGDRAGRVVHGDAAPGGGGMRPSGPAPRRGGERPPELRAGRPASERA